MKLARVQMRLATEMSRLRWFRVCPAPAICQGKRLHRHTDSHCEGYCCKCCPPSPSLSAALKDIEPCAAHPNFPATKAAQRQAEVRRRQPALAQPIACEFGNRAKDMLAASDVRAGSCAVLRAAWHHVACMQGARLAGLQHHHGRGRQGPPQAHSGAQGSQAQGSRPEEEGRVGRCQGCQGAGEQPQGLHLSVSWQGEGGTRTQRREGAAAPAW